MNPLRWWSGLQPAEQIAIAALALAALSAFFTGWQAWTGWRHWQQAKAATRPLIDVSFRGWIDPNAELAAMLYVVTATR